MRGTTHIAAGAVTAIYLATSPVEGAAIVVGSLLPDIDVGSSKLGKYNPFAIIIPHRGVTHSILFTLLMGLIYKPLAIGVLTHLILDMLNPKGVSLLWPLPLKIHLPIIGNIDSGGIIDFVIMAALILLLVYKIVLASMGTW